MIVITDNLPGNTRSGPKINWGYALGSPLEDLDWVAWVLILLYC